MFEIKLTRDEKTGELPALTTNAAILDAWSQWVRARLSGDTLGNYVAEAKRFLGVLDANKLLATAINRNDLAQYVDSFGQRCRNYQFAGFKQRAWVCTEKQDLAQCGTKCPLYEAVDYEVVRTHLTALASLYDFLAWRGYIPYDPLEKVKSHWLADNKSRKRERKRRKPTQTEVEALVNSTPHPNYKLVYALCPKTGVRHDEVLRLRVGPEYLNLEAGWAHLPKRRQSKRRGNHDLPLDNDVRRLAAWYMEWWTRKVKRDDEGRPVHDSLIINNQGLPLEYEALTRRMAMDCLRLGINKPGQAKSKRLTLHGFRHFFSDTIRTNGCNGFLWHVLRGDKPPGTLGAYNHEDPVEIKAEYEKVRPQFRINMPSIHAPRTLPPTQSTQPGVPVPQVS